MLISNATRLTGVKVHSPKLINTDLSQCTYMREIDISGCTALGTGTGSQSILNIQSCKYLKKINAKDTQLTAIYTNQNGGNLEEIHYPLSIQTIELRNLLMLKTIDIPQGSNLSSLTLVNCPNIQTLTGDIGVSDSKILNYVRYLSIQNCYPDKELFEIIPYNLISLNLESMPNLKEIAIGAICTDNYSIPTLSSMSFNNLPNVKTFCFTRYKGSTTSTWDEIENNNTRLPFVNGTTLDLTGLRNLETYIDRLLIRGVTKLLVPQTLKEILVYNGTTSGESTVNIFPDIVDIWCPDTANHADDYHGFDGAGLTLNNLLMTYLINVPDMINCNIRLNSNVGLRVNMNRRVNGGNCITPKGIIDYSNCTTNTYNWEFSRYNDTDDELEIIFPVWDKTRTYMFTGAFDGTTLNISWDIANDIMNNVTFNAGYLFNMFNSATLQPFEKYEGLDVSIVTNGNDTSENIFNSSNLPKIIRYDFPNTNNINSHFSYCNLDNSMDIVNDIFKWCPKASRAERTFQYTQFSKPFEKYNGIILESENLTYAYATFRYTNLNKIEKVNCPNITTFTNVFTSCTFDQPWDIVNEVFEGLPKVTDLSGCFSRTNMQSWEGEGLTIRLNSLLRLYDTFYLSNMNKIKEVVCPELITMQSAFKIIDTTGTPKEFLNSWDVVNEIFANCPKVEVAINTFNSIYFQPFEKYEGLIIDSENLTSLQSSFAYSNLRKTIRINCPNLESIREGFRFSDSQFDDFDFEDETSWDVYLEALQISSSSLIDTGYAFYKRVCQPATKEHWSFTLDKCTYANQTFASYSSRNTRSTNFTIIIDKLEMPECLTIERMFYNADLKEAHNFILPKCSNLSRCFDGIRGAYVTLSIIDGVYVDVPCNIEGFIVNNPRVAKVTNFRVKPYRMDGFMTGVSACTSFDTLDLSNVTNANYANRIFNSTNNIVDLTVTGIIQVPLDISNMSRLTRVSIIQVFNALVNRTGATSMRLSIGSTPYSLLSASDLAIALDKNWEVVVR